MAWANRKRRKCTNEKWIIGRKNGRIDKLLSRMMDRWTNGQIVEKNGLQMDE